jgi:hypothetical protein
MVRTNGDVILVDDDKVPVIEVSHAEAKRLKPKKEPTEKQKANAQKLVEANRIKWAEKRKAKEEAKTEAEKGKTKIIVKPKRVYKPRTKEQIHPHKESETEDEIKYQHVSSESESDVDSEDSIIIKPSKKKSSKKIVGLEPNSHGESSGRATQGRALAKKLETLQKIDQTLNNLNPQNKYLSMLRNRF